MTVAGAKHAAGRGWLAGLLVVGLLLLWQQVVFGGPMVSLDHDVHGWVHRTRQPVVGPLAQVVADLANPPLVIVGMLLGTALFAARRQSWRPWVTGVIAAVILSVVVLALKHVVGRRGPAGDGSMLAWPSGHTTTAVVACGVIAATVYPRWGRLAALIAVLPPALVGVVMVLRNYHWVSDVLAGWLLGPLVLIAGHAAACWLFSRAQSTRPPAHEERVLARPPR